MFSGWSFSLETDSEWRTILNAIDYMLENRYNGKCYVMYILPQFLKQEKFTMKFDSYLFHLFISISF